MTTDPMEDLSQARLAALFDAAATHPVPGGGSISAVAGYLGISLLLKAIRISARKLTRESTDIAVEGKLLALSTRLLALAKLDSEAYGEYMKALQLPRGSDAEKELRTRAVGDASVTATEVPLDILDLGNEVLEVAGQVRDGILPAIVADVTAGVELVSAMSSVARENALANLPGVAAPDALRERLSQAVVRRGTLLAAFKDG